MGRARQTHENKIITMSRPCSVPELGLKLFTVLLLSLSCTIYAAIQEDGTGENQLSDAFSNSLVFSCTFSPTRVDQLYIDDVARVFATCVCKSKERLGGNFSESSLSTTTRWIHLRPIPTDPSIAQIVNEEIETLTFSTGINVTCDGESEIQQSSRGNESFVIRGLFLGRTDFKFQMYVQNISDGDVSINSADSPTAWIKDVVLGVSVIRRERAIDHIFLGIVTLLVIGANVGMGCKVELGIVKEVLSRPIAPLIGLVCQYLIMPLTAFGLVRLIGLTGGQALGLFATGCAPSGSSSNMYTYLLGGDVSLSVTLTLISLVASLGMIPLYLLTLGQTLVDSSTYIKIPFQNILISLACVLLPIGVGLIIQHKLPRASRVIVRGLRPFYILLIVCMFTVGVYSNLYIFRLITVYTILAGCSLPYIGFTLAGIAAAICRQPFARILTIAIETGLQNTGVPIILLKFSLPQPEADISIVAPVVVAMFMPLPLWIAVTIVEIRRRCCRRKSAAASEVQGAQAGVGENHSTEPLRLGSEKLALTDIREKLEVDEKCDVENGCIIPNNNDGDNLMSNLALSNASGAHNGHSGGTRL